MGKKQTTYTNEFKIKVIKEMLREDSTILEIATKHGIMIWLRKLDNSRATYIGHIACY